MLPTVLGSTTVSPLQMRVQWLTDTKQLLGTGFVISMIYLISTRPVVEVIFSLGFKGVSAVRGNFICSVNSLSPLRFDGIALGGGAFISLLLIDFLGFEKP